MSSPDYRDRDRDRDRDYGRDVPNIRKSNKDSDLEAVDWVLAILCSGIGCTVGIVYLIQGKPKGGKMLGISLLFVVLWNIVRFALIAAQQQ